MPHGAMKRRPNSTEGSQFHLRTRVEKVSRFHEIEILPRSRFPAEKRLAAVAV